MSSPSTVAALDLGSNSFHMLVAETADGQFKVVDKMREMVRLAAGLDDDNRLTDEAILRAMGCLERFGERVRGLSPANVRIVGTNTLRKARNCFEFLAQAQSALGHSIDIISGSEEARLIYLGVSHGFEDESDLRLVIDIGGGSTEIILGRHFDPLFMESLHMGCVSISDTFFPTGVIDARSMRRAEIAALQEFGPIEELRARYDWQSVIGASGTNLAIRDIVTSANWSTDGITHEALAELRRVLLDAGSVERLEIAGLSAERRPVFVGGVAILSAAFEALDIDRMRVSNSALREGLLYDLLGRIHHEDVREQTVNKLVERYHVDAAQGQRVYVTAAELLAQTGSSWVENTEDSRRLLRWAASLHEIGHAISHSQHHKHGGYLLTHLDMPGFAQGEQRRLAALVRAHRRKVPTSVFESLPDATGTELLQLSVLLRLSVVLHRRRSAASLATLQANTDDKTIKVTFPEGWLDARPLTRADLNTEAGYLKAAGYKLKFR